MIDKIRGVLSVRDDVDAVKADIASLSSEIRNLTEHYRLENLRVKELHATQGDMLSAFLQATQSLGKLKDDIRREIDEFRMFSRQAQSKMMDRFNQEVSTVLTNNTKALELDKSQYEKMRSDVQKQGELLSQLNVEIGKLVLISQRIKSQDFELTDYHKKILEADHNKLQLMQRIDELERMIARFKRDGSRG